MTKSEILRVEMRAAERYACQENGALAALGVRGYRDICTCGTRPVCRPLPKWLEKKARDLVRVMNGGDS